MGNFNPPLFLVLVASSQNQTSQNKENDFCALHYHSSVMSSFTVPQDPELDEFKLEVYFAKYVVYMLFLICIFYHNY